VPVFRGVGVVAAGHQPWRVPDVLEGVGRQAPLAAVVVEGLCAVNQLLLSEGGVFTLAEDVPMGFNGPNSRESPARATSPLVLDRADHPLFPPVEGRRDLQFEVALDFQAVGSGAILRGHEPQRPELVLGQVCEIVDALGPG
jgi:hypothetical protein